MISCGCGLPAGGEGGGNRSLRSSGQLLPNEIIICDEPPSLLVIPFGTELGWNCRIPALERTRAYFERVCLPNIRNFGTALLRTNFHRQREALFEAFVMVNRTER